MEEVNSISIAESGRCSYSISANHFKVNVIDCTTLHNFKQNQSRIIEYDRCISLTVNGRDTHQGWGAGKVRGCRLLQWSNMDF